MTDAQRAGKGMGVEAAWAVFDMFWGGDEGSLIATAKATLAAYKQAGMGGEA